MVKQYIDILKRLKTDPSEQAVNILKNISKTLIQIGMIRKIHNEQSEMGPTFLIWPVSVTSCVQT